MGGDYIRRNFLDYNNLSGNFQDGSYLGGNFPGEIVRVGVILGRNCPGGSYPGGIFLWWEFFGWELSERNIRGGIFRLEFPWYREV